VKPSEAVASAVAHAPGALFVSSLGTATSALRLVTDDGPHLYLGGAMGCGLAVALGVAEARPERAVVAVVGDGDLAMGAGSLWSLSGLRPSNLLVLVLDDGRYAITGGQELVAPDVLAAIVGVLPGIASARADSPDDVAEAVRSIRRPGIVLAEIDDPAWPGPSPFVDPPLVRQRFASYAAGEAGANVRLRQP
jgi:thiamine pyrophosphate-dependent acetolactate synthase large subunit-like protein